MHDAVVGLLLPVATLCKKSMQAFVVPPLPFLMSCDVKMLVEFASAKTAQEVQICLEPADAMLRALRWVRCSA